jgi:hypothetical protein
MIHDDILYYLATGVKFPSVGGVAGGVSRPTGWLIVFSRRFPAVALRRRLCMIPPLRG